MVATGPLGPQATPFGNSQPIYRCRARSGEFLFLSRHGESGYERTPSFVNYRANVYALKDLGTRSIVSWSETRAISHNFKIGQYVVVDDVVDPDRDERVVLAQVRRHADRLRDSQRPAVLAEPVADRHVLSVAPLLPNLCGRLPG